MKEERVPEAMGADKGYARVVAILRPALQLVQHLARNAVLRFGATFLFSYWLLKLMSGMGVTFVFSAGLAMLSWFLAEALSNAIVNTLPRHLIHDRSSKAVFITGCDTGFGNLLARKLDSLGFAVFAGCLAPTSRDALDLSETTSSRCRTLYADVTMQSSLDEARKTIEKTLEANNLRLWAVVNNAGIGAFTEIEWCPIEIYQRIVDVNTMGPIRVTQTFLPLLRQSQGRIVIVASLAGRYTFPGSSAYSISKSAIVCFADALRMEMMKWGISIHTVEPTVYRTPLSAEQTMKQNLQKIWDQLPKDIKDCYGANYYQDFLTKLSQFSNSARPVEKIAEVIDDLVDAVAGVSPQCRYVPNIITQLRARFIRSLPTSVQDKLLCKIAAPSTPPAAAPTLPESSLQKSINALNNPRRTLRRHMSSPLMTFKRAGSFMSKQASSTAKSELTEDERESTEADQ